MAGQDEGLTSRGLITVMAGGAGDPKVVARIIDRGLIALTGEATPAAAWGGFFTPGVRVGLKINLLGRSLICTAPEVTDTVASPRSLGCR
jgi:hypothetical protein